LDIKILTPTYKKVVPRQKSGITIFVIIIGAGQNYRIGAGKAKTDQY